MKPKKAKLMNEYEEDKMLIMLSSKAVSSNLHISLFMREIACLNCKISLIFVLDAVLRIKHRMV